MNVGGGAGTVLQLVSTGDPLDLTGREVRAGSKGETHRVSVAVDFEILQGQVGRGQYPNQTKNSPASTGPNLAVVP